MEDRRKFPRRRVFKGASIACDSGTISATVRNLSVTGAAIEVKDAQLPHEFTLMIPTDGFLSSCHVIWRDQRRIGIAFG
jgi:hypothetical protein